MTNKINSNVTPGKELKNRYILNNHISAVHEKIKKNICTICGKEFFEQSKLKRHTSYVHQAKKTKIEVMD